MANYIDIFNRKRDRQCLRIFKKMSNYLGGRTPRQCRSHFQKLKNRFQVPLRAIKYFKDQYGQEKFDNRLKKLSEILPSLSNSNREKNKKKKIQKIDASFQIEFQEPKQPAMSPLDALIMNYNQYQAQYLNQMYMGFFWNPSNFNFQSTSENSSNEEIKHEQ